MPVPPQRPPCAASAASGVVLVLLAVTKVGGLPLFFAALFVTVATLGLIMRNATAAALATITVHLLPRGDAPPVVPTARDELDAEPA
jgi:hypothetical protein